jgi:hypothetical protein
VTPRSDAQAEPKPCTCHPDDHPPVPCARRYALQACQARRLIEDNEDTWIVPVFVSELPIG